MITKRNDVSRGYLTLVAGRGTVAFLLVPVLVAPLWDRAAAEEPGRYFSLTTQKPGVRNPADSFFFRAAKRLVLPAEIIPGFVQQPDETLDYTFDFESMAPLGDRYEGPPRLIGITTRPVSPGTPPLVVATQGQLSDWKVRALVGATNALSDQTHKLTASIGYRMYAGGIAKPVAGSLQLDCWIRITKL